MAFGVNFTPPLNTNSNYAGFGRVYQAQQQQLGMAANSGGGESVALSGRARVEAAYDRTGQAWSDLRIPITTPADEKKGLENLTFLRSVGRHEGGGLKLHDDSHEKGLSAASANEALHNGRPVLFYESGADEPINIRSFGQLTEVTQDLRARIAQTQQAQR